MSDGPDPFDEDPAADALPDLVGDGPGWDGPLTDLADEARAGRRRSTAAGPGGPRDVIGADAGGVLSDDAPPADLASEAPDAPPADLTAEGRDAPLPDLGGAVAEDGDPWAPAPWTGVAEPGDGTGAGDGPVDPTRRSGRSRRRRADGDPLVRPGLDDADDAPRDPPEPGGAAPRGLATGGLAGGLEPGTLFSNPHPAGDQGSERAARGGRRGRRRGAKRATGEAEGGPGGDGSGAAATAHPRTAEERLQHALKLAYRHLTKRDRTVSEVRTHLEKREVDETSIAAALAELVEFRYLDDERYAARFVEDKRRLEGWGHLRIEQGLRRTGVDREVADRAVAADPLRGEEPDLAVETLERRFGGRAPEDDRARQKALRVLATKGYPLDTAYAAVRTYERRCAERDDG